MGIFLLHSRMLQAMKRMYRLSRIIFFLLVVIFIITSSCQNPNIRPEDLQGIWRYTGKGDEKLEPFGAFCTSNSLFPCKEKIYFTGNQIEYPIGFKKAKVFRVDNFASYELSGNTLIISLDEVQYSYQVNLKKDALCFGEGDQFCFVRERENLIEIDSALIFFEILVEGEISLDLKIYNNYCEIYNLPDSLARFQKIELDQSDVNYLQTLLGRIKQYDLNRIFNNSLSHCREYKIGFRLNNDKLYSIVTCGFGYENPFEVRAFLVNMHRLQNKISEN